jgi:long-chain acyl-CoA synthetase
MKGEFSQWSEEMDKPWLKHYPEGIPAEVDFTAYGSLKEILETSCARFADLPAYGNMGVSITYRELDALSRDFGAYLQKVAGLKKGDRLAIMLPNLLQYPVALFGALRAGVVVVNVNPLYTARELEHQLKDSGASAIVVLENFAHTLQEVLAAHPGKTVITTQIGDMFPAFKRMLTNLVVKHVKKMVPAVAHDRNAGDFNERWRRARTQTLDDVPIRLDDLAFLQYTGGTTGVAKGAMLTQATWWPTCSRSGLDRARPARRQGDDADSAAAVPRVRAHREPGVHEDRRAHRAGHQPARHAGLHPPAEEDAGHRHDRRQHAVQRAAQRAGLRRTRPAPAEARRPPAAWRCSARWRSAGRRRTGVPLIEGYGLTETAPVAIANPLDIDGVDRHHRLPDPETEAAILDDEGDPNCRSARWARSRARPAGDAGLLAAAGRDRAGVHADGWLRTGDMGFMDERGYFKHHRPQEGHDHRLRLQGVPERGRGRGDDAPRRAGVGRGRRARRARRRGGQDRGRAQGPGADRAGRCSTTAGST